MIRLIALLPRRPDLTHAEFMEHWLERHAPLIAGCGVGRHVLRYEQHEVARPDGWPEPEFDGMTVQWFESPAAFAASLAEPDNALIREDEGRFLDMSRLKWMLTEDPPHVPMNSLGER